MVIAAGGKKHGWFPHPLRHLEAKNIPVKPKRSLQLRNLEMDVTNPHATINPTWRRRIHTHFDAKTASTFLVTRRMRGNRVARHRAD
jgi:hypothetical protein